MARRGRGSSRGTRASSRPEASSRSSGTDRRARSTPANNTGRAAAVEDDIPSVYREMLSEIGQSTDTPSSPIASSGHHAVKRRRVGERSAGRAVGLFRPEGEGSEEDVTPTIERAEEADGEDGARVNRLVQTVYDVDASEDDEESGMEWEDVDFDTEKQGAGAPTLTSGLRNEQQSAETDEPLQITLEKHDEKGKRKIVRRRKPVTGAEKKRRLDVHKMHILCLLSHVRMRNRWCNDEEVQKALKRILPKHIIMLLNPKPEMSQFTRSTTFADGLKQAAETFRRRFKITAPGMRRPYWLQNPQTAKDSSVLPEGVEILQSKGDFRAQAMALQGSRDLGAQLFCAMLRGVGVEARLVCSLQTLPFSGVAKGERPENCGKEYIVLSESEAASSGADTRSNTPTTQSPATPVRRLGQPQFSSRPLTTPKPGSRLGHPFNFSDSRYPVYWVEAFNAAMQKWVSVDPLVTNTIGKPSRLEPPSSDPLNNMHYVIAFEEDLSARDVTRRYVKSFNSKTRRNRVESTKDGEKWWERTMKIFERPCLEDRDQVELGELTANAAGEGMPRNVQDFKDHPIYALERHLRRNEVIYPKRVIGKVGLSKTTPAKKDPQLESVYRRADVHIVKSADGWFRQGRRVKPGEQPLKRVPVSRNRMARMQDVFGDDEEEEEAQETPMYAMFQTELYEPPPVVNGKVPKNSYGNIDVYTENMIPSGGFHLNHPDAALAAKILGIDYADAVTGFQFKGRHGTAVINGIVAAAEYREALHVVLSGLEDQRAQEEQERRTRAALRMWKLLLIKLRVAERIESYTFEGDDQRKRDEAERTLPADDSEDSGGGGGFLPEEGGGFIPEDEQGNAPLMSDTPAYGGSGSGHRQAALVGDSRGNRQEPEGRDASPKPFGRDLIAGQSRAELAATTLGRSPSFTTRSSKPLSQYNLVVVPNPNKSARGDSALEPAHRPKSAPETGSQLPPDDVPESSSVPAVEEPASVEGPLCGEESISKSEPVEDESDSSLNPSGSMLSHDPEDDDAEPDWFPF
ncbi:hypothetical protein VTO42DRAFT_1391 [Malbranchea cinnamomea]